MSPKHYFSAFLALGTSWMMAEDATRLVRETPALAPEAEKAALHPPAGFRVQLFASEPMINKPINLAFDSKGRVWVSSTVEYPFAADKSRWADPQGSRVEGSRDAIKILEDTDGDGAADKVTNFATGLNIPTGAVPWHKPDHHAGCIAWSIPNIWYFADTDGDDRADLREVIFGPLGYEKDTHGMCSSFRLGSDGWIYATHGFNNTSHLKARDGSSLDLHSGNVFRFRPDGSSVQLYSAGQVNPFGLCWDRNGNLYSADCHSNPITQLIRGAYYPSFGKPHDGLGYGPVMCQHSHGSTGLCGIVYIDSGIWGPEWDDHILVGNCVTSKVNHDTVSFSGSTPKANEAPDFITSDDPWFRPVDLQLGPDGALYIADFYNKIIGHYEVPLDHPGRDRERGRIWRIIPAEGVAKRRSVTEPSPAVLARQIASKMADVPSVSNLPKLLSQLKDGDAADLSLKHQVKIALRETLKLPGAIESLPDDDTRSLLEIIRAVPNGEAARALLTHCPADLALIVRHADEATLAEAITLARRSADPISALQSIHEALLERGAKPPAAFLSWATELAETVLASPEKTQVAWTHTGSGQDPWCLQERQSADGRTISVISSLNSALKGPEKLTGTLRSAPFQAPEALSFWLCGHQGPPKTEPNQKNLVRLVGEDGAVIHQAYPPRNDTAQRIEWDLTAVKGRLVAFEIIDGDNGGAYAWLGVGALEPPVITTDSFQTANARQQQLRTLASVLRTTAPVALRDKLAAFLPAEVKLPPPPPGPALAALLTERTSGYAKAKTNLAHGEQIFTVNCAACHQIQSKGGIIGPQLDGISNRGAARIIEDVLDPYRNVDAHFQIHQIKRRDGSLIVGFVRGEIGQSLIVVDALGNEQRLALGDIAEDTTLPASLMPPNFGETLPAQDFYDLIGWLMSR